jgi:hypothetical protein
MLISRRLLDVAHRMDGLRTKPVAAEQAVPIESLDYEPEEEIVPVERLAPDAPTAAAATPPAPTPAARVPAPAAPAETVTPPTGLETSFRTFERLVREGAPTTASLDALLATAAAPRTAPVVPDVVPVVSEVEEPAVAIGTLCYRGHAALERANAVRHQITAELAREPSLESLQPLLQELLDLVPLALAES